MCVCYKSKNIAISYNSARRLLGTNPNLASQAKLTTQVVEATKLTWPMKNQAYLFWNPFVICQICVRQNNVYCLYCTTRFVPSHEGKSALSVILQVCLLTNGDQFPFVTRWVLCGFLRQWMKLLLSTWKLLKRQLQKLNVIRYTDAIV